ncbi:MAG: hypothetical protein ACO2PN_09255 [Pyrobaculum sp.]|jgi:hypothetical protein
MTTEVLTNVEAVRRWLAERGAVWTERWGPPPRGIYALRDMHPPSHAEEACRQGLPLVYIAAVDRSGLYYIFGDVAWTPQLEKICRAVTFVVETEPLRDGLNAIVKFVARTRHLPWVSFRPEVLRLAGICDEVRIECEPREVWKKMVETAKSKNKNKTETASGGRTAPEAEEAGGGSPEGSEEDGAKSANDLGNVGGASVRVLHAEVRRDHGDGGGVLGGGARGGLDPAAVAAVLRAVERCLGREAVERLTACLYV